MSRLAALAFAFVGCSFNSPAGARAEQAAGGFCRVVQRHRPERLVWTGHFDPRKLRAMSDQERAAKREANMADVQAHWRVENGELVNDGHGVYLTTDREFRDYEFWIDYKTVAKADSGIYLKATPQVQIWDFTEAGGKWSIGADKGSGGLWNNSAGIRARTRSCWPTNRLASGTACGSCRWARGPRFT